MDLTLRQLAIFDAVARLGSVSQAAVELHLSQSAASMALQNLERPLGKQLFLRAGKRLVLSYHGKQLQPMARSILLAAEELGKAVTEEDIPGGQLRVGASPTVGDYLLNDLCGMFMAKHPEVRLSIIVLPALDVINRVDEMAVDVGLIEFVSVRPTLDVIRWRKSVFSVFCSPHHPLAGEKRVSTRDLEDESWCLQHRHADSRRAGGRNADRTRRRGPRTRHSVPHRLARRTTAKRRRYRIHRFAAGRGEPSGAMKSRVAGS
jgi:DNA-binding transcriptional LysR family regulator